jgi:chromate transporter
LSIVLAGLITWAFHQRPSAFVLGTTSLGATTGLLGLAFKVGALSFGGGFVIVAMMRHDAVTTHHWMSSDLFAQAVALGQLTPGPVVATIGAVGYAVGGTKLAVAAAVIAFLPSFLFVGLGAPFFERVRTSVHALAFFRGASAAALGLIVTSGVVLTQGFHSWWEWCSVATLVVMGSRLSPLWLLGCGTLVGLAHLAVTAG